ncbi:hypothetical protein Tco_0039677 [Tanacetum coccineum]
MMANLRFCDKHNMVAFLKKPTKSEGFTKIVDFLEGSNLRYALSHNPTIYYSLIKQFWQAATVRTTANGNQELVESIDNKEYTITEAYVRSKLQLADAAGISNLPDADIYAGLTTLGYVTKGDQVPLLPAMLVGAAQDQGKGSAILTRSQPPLDPETEIPQSQGPTFTHVADEATTIRVGVDTEGSITTTSSLDAGLESGNIHESPLRSYETPLHEGHTSGSVEDSVKLQELTVLVPKLESKVDSLEKELKETKQTLGHAILTLVKKVKSLEVALKRQTKKVVMSKSEGEEIEDQGRKIQDINNDPLVSLVKDFVTPSKIKVSASGEAQEGDISPTTLEAAKTLSRVASLKAKSTDKGKRFQRRAKSTKKGKDIDAGNVDINTGFKDINTGFEDINTGFEEINTGSIGVSVGSGPVSTPNVVQTVNIVIPSPVKSQREGKALIITDDTSTRRTKAAS